MGQGSSLVSRGVKYVGGLAFLNRSAQAVTVKGINQTTVSVNPASIATVSTGATDVTITGIAVGDALIGVERPAGINDDLIVSGWRIKAADTITLFLYNPTGGSIDDGALSWVVTWLDLT